MRKFIVFAALLTGISGPANADWDNNRPIWEFANALSNKNYVEVESMMVGDVEIDQVEYKKAYAKFPQIIPMIEKVNRSFGAKISRGKFVEIVKNCHLTSVNQDYHPPVHYTFAWSCNGDLGASGIWANALVVDGKVKLQDLTSFIMLTTTAPPSAGAE